VRLALTTIYAHNPGADYQLHWLDHLWYLWLAPKPNILALGLYGGALAAGLWHWREQPAFLRAAAIIIPIVFGVYWVLGYPGEIRVCLEAYPVLYLLTWNTTARVLGAHWRTMFRTSGSGEAGQLAPS